MPVRKIPKNYRNVTGIASRNKALGQAMFESTLERDFISLLEFDSAVDQFEVQPLSIDWQDENGRLRSYTPDILVYYRSSMTPTTLYEVKYRSELKEKWPELKPKFKAARRFARSKGWIFKLVTEKQIRTTPLENVKFLLSFAHRVPIPETDMDILDKALNQLGESTPAQLLSSIYQDEWNRARLLPTLWYLVASKQIAIDMNRPITMASRIWSIGE